MATEDTLIPCISLDLDKNKTKNTKKQKKNKLQTDCQLEKKLSIDLNLHRFKYGNRLDRDEGKEMTNKHGTLLKR